MTPFKFRYFELLSLYYNFNKISKPDSVRVKNPNSKKSPKFFHFFQILSYKKRHKWDYVAEIFVDLQDLHEHPKIPKIIDSINEMSSRTKIGPLLHEITKVVADIQGKEFFII